jgi:hypothetical protein
MLLLDEIATLYALSPRAFLIAAVSAASFRVVEVPCAGGTTAGGS